MHDKLLALALLFLLTAGGGCAMCDSYYPYGPTVPPNGGHYGRAGSVLEPMPYGAIPQTSPGEVIEGEPMMIEGEPMVVE